jgi:hypothetical protein
MISWPGLEPEVGIETQEVSINEREYFMSVACRKVPCQIDIRGSNLLSCVSC